MDCEKLISDLLTYDEEEWLEFKENWFEPHAIGEYISALSNAAAMRGKEYAYLVWGISDATHELTVHPLIIKGTSNKSLFSIS